MSVEVIQKAQHSPYKRLRTTSDTTNGFPARLPTATEPVMTQPSSVIPLGRNGAMTPTDLLLQFFGAGANNNTFLARIMGVKNVLSENNLSLWVWDYLCDVTVTLSATVIGVASQIVVATDLFADTISVTNGIGIVSQCTTGDLYAARLEVGVDGYTYAEVLTSTGGVATSANALWSVR